jgi:hypothetical protein
MARPESFERIAELATEMNTAIEARKKAMAALGEARANRKVADYDGYTARQSMTMRGVVYAVGDPVNVDGIPRERVKAMLDGFWLDHPLKVPLPGSAL